MGCNQNKDHEKELLTSIRLGPYKLKNRVIMAAMTRMRADPSNGIPTELHVKYYSERAEDAGLVITESSAICPRGNCAPGSALCFTKEHMDGWKKVVEEVHKKNGRIFLQLFHCGRAADKTLLGGLAPVAPSAIKLRYGDKYDEPEELDLDQIKEIIHNYIASAKLAKDTGFDGVEIHAANGYLIDNFLRDATNKRTDEYGGSIEKRCKFLLQIIDEVSKIFDSVQIGVKLTPVGRFNDMYDSNPIELINYLVPELSKRKIAFIEMCQAPDGTKDIQYDKTGEEQIPDIYKDLKKKLGNTLLVGNCGFTPEEANRLVTAKIIDMVSFARNYIGNPDLCNRIKNNWELAQPDFNFAYTGGEKGYCDYPKHEIKDQKKDHK